MSDLDIENSEALVGYCRDAGLIAPNETPFVKVLAGGVANKTVLVEHEEGAFVIKQALSRFRVAVEWLVPPERSHLEAIALQAYEALCPVGSVPHFLYEDEASHIHAMSAIPQPHDTYKARLLAGQGSRELAEQYAALMAHVHVRALQYANSLRPQFESLDYFEAQRLHPFYAYTAQQVPAARDFLLALIEQTRATQQTLVHADFTPKNLLIYQEKLVLLDFEIVHWGDPAFDAGLALAHLLLKAVQVTDRQADYTADALTFADHYLAAVGDANFASGLAARIVDHTLACLLARVAGKSPVEYLSVQARQEVLQWVERLLVHRPVSIRVLCETIGQGR